MTTLHRASLLAIGLLLVATPCWAIGNATFTRNLFAVDAACDLPLYTYDGTADLTTIDDAVGRDWYAFVYHDATGNYHDVDFGSVVGASDPFSELDDFLLVLPFQSFFGSREIVARMHDIPDPGLINENSKEGLEFASAAPVVFELRFDPAVDAGACASKPVNDTALHIESLRNPNGTPVTSQTLLDLDGLGTTALTIAVPGPSMLVALYRAECVNDGASGDLHWVDVDILLDGVGLPPSGGNISDAFCTSNGVAGFDQWVMPRTSGGRVVSGPGVHRVEVLARTFGGTGILEDRELVVMVPEPPGGQLRAAGLAALALLAWIRRRRALERVPRALRSRVLPGCVALGLLAAFAAAPTRAATVLEGTRHATNQAFSHSAGPTLLDLGGGVTSFALNLARPARVSILFTAECAVDAANDQNWLDLDIRVDGAAVPASDDIDDAFCTATGSTPGVADEWVSTGIHVTVDLAAGAHGIEVLGKLQGITIATDVWWIGDLNLTVIGQEH